MVWPPSLKRPLTGRPVVYLDLNHWISLAKAAVGHEQGESFKDVLDTCRAAAVSGSATFVLADDEDFAGMNEEWQRWFPTDPPARSGAKMPMRLPGLKISIAAIARL